MYLSIASVSKQYHVCLHGISVNESFLALKLLILHNAEKYIPPMCRNFGASSLKSCGAHLKLAEHAFKSWGELG